MLFAFNVAEATNSKRLFAYVVRLLLVCTHWATVNICASVTLCLPSTWACTLCQRAYRAIARAECSRNVDAVTCKTIAWERENCYAGGTAQSCRQHSVSRLLRIGRVAVRTDLRLASGNEQRDSHFELCLRCRVAGQSAASSATVSQRQPLSTASICSFTWRSPFAPVYVIRRRFENTYEQS